MKRKSLLFLLLLALVAPWAANAQTLTVCDGTVTNQYIPLYGYYADTEGCNSEFIIPATELTAMNGKSISAMSFYLSSPASTAWGATFQVYMKEVSGTTLDDLNGPDGCTTVYTGELDGTGTTMDITFDEEYLYQGGNLLIGTYVTSSGSWKRAYFYGIQATGAAYVDDASGWTSGVQDFLPKTTFTYSAPAACPKPTGLAVNYTGGTTAQVSWTSDAASFNVELNGTVVATGITTTSYPLSSLQLATTYQVRVQAVCTGQTDPSDWSNPVSFTTDLCLAQDMCEITYELADSYGDGWNGNTLNVVDVATEAVLATWTIPSGGYSASGSLALCDGREIQFVWAGTSFPYENSFTVYDINGEIICQHIKDNVGPAVGVLNTYTVSCTVSSCRKPTDLATTAVFGRSAILNWTENGEATAWVVAYGVDGVEFRELNANAKPFTLENLEPETPYYVKVRPVCDVDDKWSDVITFTTEVACPAPTNVTVSNVEPFSATVSWTGTAANYNIRYRAARGFNYGFETAEGFVVDQFPPCTTYDGDGLPTYGISGYTMPNNTGNYVGSVVSFNEYFAAHSGNVMGAFMDAIPDEDAGISANDDYFILPELTIASGDHFIFWARSVNDTYGLERMKVGIYGGNGTISTYLAGSATEYVAVPVAWTEYNYDLTAYVGQTIQLAINCVSADAFALLFDDIFVGDPTDDTWDVTLNNVTSPYTLTELTDETDYEVEVQAACGGADGVSEWVGTSFMTPSNCAAPTNLAANDITYNAATLSWTGFHNNYNLKYRSAESREIYYFNDFNDEETEGWTRDYFIYGFTDPIYNVGGDDNYFLEMGWNSTEEETIISCELPAYPSGAHVEFYYFAYQTANTFQVGFSTTTNDADAFTWSDPINAPSSTYTLYNEELADGVKYVAWKATAPTVDPDEETGNLDCVFIDDFGIFGETIPAGDWQTITVTNPYPLSGLADNTEYEWYVQGINPACDGGVTPWSHMATFTTPNACQVPVIDSVANITFNGATVYWTGIQDSYNVRYTIFEPATMVNFDDQVIPADWTNDATYAWALTDTLTDAGYCIRSTNQGEASSTSTISFTATYQAAGVISFDAMFMGEGYGSYVYDKCIFSIDGNQYFAYGQIGQEWYNMAYYFAAGTHTFTWTYSKDSSVNPTGDFFAIDNIKVVLQSDTWTTIEDVTGNSYDLTGLTPESVIAVQVQGNNTVCDGGVTEWSEEYLFITDISLGQTIELHAGWNWISTYIEVGEEPIDMLLMLEEALGENGLVIKSADFITTYEDEEWFGDLDDEGIFNEQMYLVKVAADCEVVLAGDPADPADHAIDINPGWNWIGFPYDQVLSLEDALADFEAEEGDALKDDNGITMYEDEEWFGDLETLVPGQGYMYYSTSEDEKTLVFLTGEKAKRGAMPAIPNNLKKLTKKLNDSKQVKHAEVFKDMRAKKVK